MPQAELEAVTLHYRTYGSGPPVLGIMGFALDQRFWAAQVPAVTSGNTFITFDNRGTGRSSRGEPDSVDEMADDAIGLLDHLEIERAVVFGASMGGTIAQRLALDHPERVKALILAITFPRPVEYTKRLMEVAVKILRHLDVDEFTRASILWMFSPRFVEASGPALDHILASLDAPGGPEPVRPEVLEAQLAALAKFDVSQELHRIACPTLVVGGRSDLMAPVFASEEIAAAIPKSRLEIFDSGHGLMFEEMDAFNALLRSFLDSDEVTG